VRRLQRIQLEPETADWLAGQGAVVAASNDRGAEARRLWTGHGRHYEALREALGRMATGRSRCMYCEDSVGTDLDHFYPLSRYPEYAFDWMNHLLACALCNRRKSDRFPLGPNDEAMLIDPTVEDPGHHLVLSPSTGRFEPLDEKGAESIEIFGLNRPVLVQGRLDAWRTLQELIVAYCDRRRAGQAANADELFGVIARQSFATVFVALVRLASTAIGPRVIDERCRAALEGCPELLALAA
jgi:hypothetical protein